VTFEYFDRDEERWITMDPSYGIFYRQGERLLSIYELVKAFDRGENVDVAKFSDYHSDFLEFKGLPQQIPLYTDSKALPYILDGYGNVFARKSIWGAGQRAQRVYFQEVSRLKANSLVIYVLTNFLVVTGLLLAFRRAKGE
jgi:hypothetical protein